MRVEQNDTLKLKSYSHCIVGIYNSLPPYLTKMRNYSLFKKWLKIYEFNNNHINRPKANPDNTRNNVIQTDPSC